MKPGISFAGSNGLMDVPAPEWVVAEDSIFSRWGVFMLAMIKHGQVESIRREDTLKLEANEFGLMIEGGLFALVDSAANSANTPRQERPLLVSFLARGELFTPAIPGGKNIQFLPHSRATCLILRQNTLEAFKADFPTWVSTSGLLRTRSADAYTQALLESMGRDQDKIRRVLTIFAAHPTATDSIHGREFEAGKQLIRELAGVQKRSASRAFTTLEESGAVTFSGYKRIYYRESQSEEQACQHKHQQTGPICKRPRQHV
ncbi:hypothetical protein ACI77O_13360 [Pseudomonas tritici]|uniref:hypothetical protein n=1 Tax=Pseudomonas tritici TaxID=2745518 RepID=UPI00387A85DC